MVTHAVIAAVIAAAGCSYGATFRDCEIQCTMETGCPGGFSCSASESLCRATGETQSCSAISGDAGLDGMLGPSAKELTSFGFSAADNANLTTDATGTFTGLNIAATLRFANVGALAATFTTTAESVSIDGVTQTSGMTVNDFTAPVTYRLTALDGSVRDYVVTVSAPSIAPRVDVTTGPSARAVAIGDVNGDGKPDLAAAGFDADSVSVHLNLTATGATTPAFSSQFDFPTGDSPRSIAIGDINADGKPDLAVANYNSDSVSVLLNTTATGATTPTFSTKVDFTTGATPQSVAVGDFNGDGALDLAVANYASTSVSVLLSTTAMGAATPTFSTKVDFATGANPTSVAIGDANGDGKPDLAVANYTPDSVSVLLNTTATNAATPTFSTKVDFTTGLGPWSLAIGDVNGDSKPDLAVANASSTSVSVLLNTTSTSDTTPTFSARADFATGSSPYSVAIGDVNGDAKPDLAIANYMPNTVSVHLSKTAANATTPAFLPKLDFATATNPFSVAIGDVNGDGKPDLALANSTSAKLSVLLAE